MLWDRHYVCPFFVFHLDGQAAGYTVENRVEVGLLRGIIHGVSAPFNLFICLKFLLFCQCHHFVSYFFHLPFEYRLLTIAF